jgi:GNAT superfamily N-acetyltransferase
LEKTLAVWTFRVEIVTEGSEQIAREILGTLPEWFGRPQSLEDYAIATTRLLTLVAYSPDNRAIGFLSLKQLTSVAAEAHVMGVRREERNRGCGQELLAAAEENLRAKGLHWFTVKTLAASHPDPNYAQTRRFYEAVGFEPLEVLETLWDADTPCLLMIKPLR